jgi:Flp pilus assembly protein TadB
MNRGELLRRRGDVYLQRSQALNEGVRKEASLRSLVNLLAAVSAIVAVWLAWSAWYGPALMVVAGVTWLTVRILGIGIVGAWANAAIRRVHEQFPMPDESAPPESDE